MRASKILKEGLSLIGVGSSEQITATQGEPDQLVASIGKALQETNKRKLQRLLKDADKTIYPDQEVPPLPRNTIWINGGQTWGWYKELPVSGKNIFFIRVSSGNEDSVVPCIKMSLKELLKISKKTRKTCYCALASCRTTQKQYFCSRNDCSVCWF